VTEDTCIRGWSALDDKATLFDVYFCTARSLREKRFVIIAAYRIEAYLHGPSGLVRGPQGSLGPFLTLTLTYIQWRY